MSIIEKYDSDKKMPVYGYAARYPRKDPVKPVFNIKQDNSPCVGVQGKNRPCMSTGAADAPRERTLIWAREILSDVLEAYRKCLSDLTMSSPANFAPVIRKVTESIQSGDQQNYHILLILTSGQIFDLPMTETVSKYPRPRDSVSKK